MEAAGVCFNKQKQPKIKAQSHIVALLGNPNVGKSTIFNALTGMRQHTGNWPGKTVENCRGNFLYNGAAYELVDLPGTYSLMASSEEEKIACDFLCNGQESSQHGAFYDAAVVVCDATCLERNLNLVLQTLEITPRVVVCLNLMDEAKKKGISINLEKLEQCLGVPVAATTATAKHGLKGLLNKVEMVCCGYIPKPLYVTYDEPIEEAAKLVEETLANAKIKVNSRFAALRLLQHEISSSENLDELLGISLSSHEELNAALIQAKRQLSKKGYSEHHIKDRLVAGIFAHAERIYKETVTHEALTYLKGQLKADRILTGRWSGAVIMLLLLALVFYITLVGANYPSRLIAGALTYVETQLLNLAAFLEAPKWLSDALILGMFRVLSWVVSVMLPPMALFFPLFTLLEDLGYLPRVAFNLDNSFRRANACGKQSLTMCMGLGCNAAGVIGCRIINSPRERLIAILTNNFVPCNGRFPTLIAIISMFFISASARYANSLLAALMLTGFIALGIWLTFVSSKLLSKTLLRGIPSSFALELPPYRVPQVAKVLLRSLFERTLFVLGRAALVAAPMGLFIWLLANIRIEGLALLKYCTAFLDNPGRIFGLDGAILMAFILGLPANEIVMPLLIMTYLSEGALLELDSLLAFKTLLLENGWTWITALCTMLFTLLHWPCSTALITIWKETKSLKWTIVAFLLPTAFGLALCAAVAALGRTFGIN